LIGEALDSPSLSFARKGLVVALQLDEAAENEKVKMAIPARTNCWTAAA